MFKLLDNLFKGNTRFYLDKTDFQNYAILLAISKSDSTWAGKASSIIIRANAKEPMDLDLEAERLYMEVMLDAISIK